MGNEIEFIRTHLSQEELLCQLAEECAEMGKAALKLRRVYDGTNPTPVKEAEAYNNLLEEFADVMLCASVLGLDNAVNFHKMCKITLEKTKRWQQRLTNAVSEE